MNKKEFIQELHSINMQLKSTYESKNGNIIKIIYSTISDDNYKRIYECTIKPLAERLPKEIHRSTLVNMLEDFYFTGELNTIYNIEGKLVQTPMELYNIAFRNKLSK